jgi:hypothetical protein
MQFERQIAEGEINIPPSKIKAFKEIWRLIRKIERVEAKLPFRLERDQTGDLVLEGVGAMTEDGTFVIGEGAKVGGAPATMQIRLEPGGKHVMARIETMASA